jgi:hypothetical protein
MPHLALVFVLSAALAAATTAHAAPPSWSKKIDGAGRFKILKAFDDLAVLDKETGIVWEKTATTAGTWRNAFRICALRNTGGRMGWRMPSLEELLTLVDPNETSPAMPDGAPFENVLGTAFWTANEEQADPTLAVTVNLDVFILNSVPKSGVSRKVLCARGPGGAAESVRGGE